MIIYEFTKKRSKRKYQTTYSPFAISRLYIFDAEFKGDSFVISANEVNFKSFTAIEV
jgi:hypothetical protein